MRGNEKEEEKRKGKVRARNHRGGGGGRRFWGSVSSGGVILETNQCLIHSWGLVGLQLFLLGCRLAGSCPEECTGACLWKAEAVTSSSLTVAQSGNCLSWKKRGMEQECRKKPITLSCPPRSLVPLFLSPPLIHCPSLSPPLPSLCCSPLLAASLPITRLTFCFPLTPPVPVRSGFRIWAKKGQSLSKIPRGPLSL